MNATLVRQRQIRWLALIVCALSLVVVGVSAYLRLDAAGLGCTDWPACYGQVLGATPPPLHYGAARLVHRLAASTALVLAIVLVWRCLRPLPLRPAANYSVLLLLLMLALSVLGFFSADPRRALVGFLNIVGGLGLVTFSWRVVMAADAAPASDVQPGRLQRAGVLALSAAVLLGAWVGATYSAVACTSLPWCAAAGGDVASALNPLLLLESAPLPGDPSGALLHLLHRGMALLALLLLGVAAFRQRRSVTKPVLALLALTLLFGVLSVASGLALWLVIAHGVAAALLLAAVAALLRR